MYIYPLLLRWHWNGSVSIDTRTFHVLVLNMSDVSSMGVCFSFHHLDLSFFSIFRRDFPLFLSASCWYMYHSIIQYCEEISFFLITTHWSQKHCCHCPMHWICHKEVHSPVRYTATSRMSWKHECVGSYCACTFMHSFQPRAHTPFYVFIFAKTQILWTGGGVLLHLPFTSWMLHFHSSNCLKKIVPFSTDDPHASLFAPFVSNLTGWCHCFRCFSLFRTCAQATWHVVPSAALTLMYSLSTATEPEGLK